MRVEEKYYLTGKGRVLLEAGPALKPEVLGLLDALESRTGVDVAVPPSVLAQLLEWGYIGRIEEFEDREEVLEGAGRTRY